MERKYLRKFIREIISKLTIFVLITNSLMSFGVYSFAQENTLSPVTPQPTSIETSPPTPTPTEIPNITSTPVPTIKPTTLPSTTVTPTPISQTSTPTPVQSIEPTTNPLQSTPTPTTTPTSQSPIDALQKFIEESSSSATLIDYAIKLPFNSSYPISLGFGEIPDDSVLQKEYESFGIVAHDGIDYELPDNTEVLASDLGIVLSAGPGLYGTTVAIYHTWGMTYYGHLSKVSVEPGQIVEAGALIGHSGNTGLTTGPHLHFSVKPKNPNLENGFHGMVDPNVYLDPKPQGNIIIIPNTSQTGNNLKVFRPNENPEIGFTINERSLNYNLIDFDGKRIYPQKKITKKNNKKYFGISGVKNFRPGKYTLKMTNGDGEAEEQEFYWGVLAVNTNKSIYLPGEVAYLQMASLDDNGHTICDGKLELTINKEVLSTENGKIRYSDSCGIDNVTDSPDYYANYQPDKTGIYKMSLKNLNNGYEINDSFEVKASLPFEVERVGATRINPSKANYKMTIKIKANEDIGGTIKEQVPQNFEITPETGIKVETVNNIKEISWDKEIKSGEVITLQYEYNAPDESPQFYLLGPIKLVSLDQSVLFQEARQWQIASDAVSYVSKASSIQADTSGDGSITVLMPAHLLYDILLVTATNASGGDIVTVTTNGWSEIAEVNGTCNTNWFWKRAASTVNEGPAITSTGTDLFTYGYVIRGVSKGLENPFVDVTTAGNCTTADNNPDTATITTTADNQFVINMLNVNDDTAWTTGPPPNSNGWNTLNADDTTGIGTDARFTFMSQTKATAGDVTATQIGTISTTELWGSVTFALLTEDSPTVVLNSPADASSTSDTTPTLNFTGTDVTTDTIEYNVQVDTVNTFDSTTVADSIVDSIDSGVYEFAHHSVFSTTFGVSRVCQSFKPRADAVLTSAKFYLSKTGTPSGDTIATLYAHSGTYGTSSVPTGVVLATSDIRNASSITTSYIWETYTFSGGNQYSLVNNTPYVICFEFNSGGDASNYINLAVDSVVKHSGNTSSYVDPTWSAASGADIYFYVYGTADLPLISKISGIFNTYYFDGSDAGATDPNAVWTNDSNAFDGLTTNNASTTTAGSTSTNFLKAEGTNAPADPGRTISQVKVRMFGSPGSETSGLYAVIYTDGLAENLGSAYKPINGFVSNYTILTAPSGGWTWAKVQALETKIYSTGTSIDTTVSRVEIEVNSTPGGFTAGNPFTSGSAIDYTVPAGAELIAGNTYYWRVAAIDRLGTLQWGAWSTTWSFTESSSGPTTDQQMRHGKWFNTGTEQPFTF